MLAITTFLFVVLVCSYAEAGYGCPRSLTQSDRTRTIFLDFHNEVRRNISLGKQPNKQGFLGPAKNMYELNWDCNLEQKALEQISSCAFSIKPGLAQNIIRITYRGYGEDAVLKFAQKTWLNVMRYKAVTNRFQYWFEPFANIANSKTLKLGCAYKTCGASAMFVSCVYEGGRLLPNHVLWEAGKACQCNAYPASSCSNSLCVTKKPVGSKTTRATTTTTKRPAVMKPPPKEPVSAKCTNKGMTDELRQIFLNKHNHYRSYVAKGQAKDKLIPNGNAPKAARMRKMVYDCKVEASAMRHAKKCKYGHSLQSERPDFGENVWAISYNRMDKARSAEMSCDDWFNELAKTGVGRENILTKKLFYRPQQIGHYTQMVWQNTYKLGCAVEWCPTMTFVVCQYNPPGNYLDQLIYEMGEPCRRDQDCRCPNCKCSRNEALCIVP